jgi:membrane-bound metal-dependent hydrolase YbcI (DUF457 family)
MVMYTEHIVYSLAFAIVAVMLIRPRDAGLCTLLFVISGCIPDIDGIFDVVRHPPTFTDIVIPHMAEHTRMFHTAGALVLYAIIAGIFLYRLKGLTFVTGAFFAGAGFAAHLFEDALVYNPSSAIFWPLSSQEVGIGVLPGTRDFFSIADPEVLALGILLLVLAAGASFILKRTEWAELPWVDEIRREIPSIDEILHLPKGVPVAETVDDYEPLQRV